MIRRSKMIVPAVFFLLAVGSASGVSATALDRYVRKPDSAFAYRQIGVTEAVFAKTYFLSMTSQQWRSSAEVDHPLWEHDVSITVPSGALLDKTRTAILIIDGGTNTGVPEKKLTDNIEVLAFFTRAPVVVVHQIPNQPLRFLEENPPRARTEDAILAYSGQRFLASCNSDGTGCDREWPVHLAMVKAVVRTMDTAQTFLRQRGLNVSDFVVTGASKRGWTTWLTAAVDPRVRGIIPISFDLLNIEQQVARNWAAYNGHYAPALDDYAAVNLFCEAKKKLGGRKLFSIIDPLAYRERLRMPKLIINSAGDQFFLPDSSQLYYRQLPGDNRLRYTFNTDHSQEPLLKDVLLNAVGWFNAVKRSKQPPRYDWEVRDGKIVVTTAGPVKSVAVWRATNAQGGEMRDFRLATLGTAWRREPLAAVADNRYEASLTPAAPGTWTAQSVEVEFENRSGFLDLIGNTFREASLLRNKQVFTTDVVIRPRRLPRDPRTHCSNL